MLLKRTFYPLVLLMHISILSLQAQEWRSTSSIGISVKLSKDWKLAVTESYGFRFEPTRLSFKESSGTAFFALPYSYDGFLGYTHSLNISKSKKASHRHSLSGGFSRSFNTDKLKIDFRLKTEYHFRPQNKYRIRILPQLRLRSRKKLAGITPFISFRLYYYLGGDPIKQYNHKGQVMQEVAPYGFHRFRLSTGCTYRLGKSIFAKVKLTSQREFNTIFAYKHRINVLNPETGKISRPFNHYWMFGFGLTYVIKHNNKFSKKKSSFDADQVW